MFLVGGKTNVLTATACSADAETDILSQISRKYPGKTKSNILIRWAIQKGIQPLPKSKNKDRIKENFDVFDFRFGRADPIPTMVESRYKDRMQVTLTYTYEYIEDFIFKNKFTSNFLVYSYCYTII